MTRDQRQPVTIWQTWNHEHQCYQHNHICYGHDDGDIPMAPNEIVQKAWDAWTWRKVHSWIQDSVVQPPAPGAEQPNGIAVDRMLGVIEEMEEYNVAPGNDEYSLGTVHGWDFALRELKTRIQQLGEEEVQI